MLRFLVKLALTVVVASSAWNLGSAYLTHHRFREAVRQATSEHRREEPLRQAILEEADRYGVPMAA